MGHTPSIIEEPAMFPIFESVSGVGSLETNVEQHHAFSPGLETLRDYAVNTPPKEYSGLRVWQIVDRFANPFRMHLADEIGTLWDMEKVSTMTGDSHRLLEIYQQCEANAGKQDKTVVPPMVLGLCDKTFEGGNEWPKMPVGSAWIVHYVFGRKPRGAWRFLPCDTWRNPRPLVFVEKGDPSA